jgi:type I restriction enzyme M protein
MTETLKNNASSQLVGAFDLLRHSFSSGEIAHYMLALTFLRWLTELKYRRTGHDEFVFLSPDGSTVPFLKLEVPYELDYLNLMLIRQTENIGEELNRVFASLEELNPAELGGVFRGLDFASGKFSAPSGKFSLLSELIALVGNLEVKNRNGELENLVGHCIDVASSALVNGFYSPEFNTPQSICDLVAKLMAPAGGEAVYDPACGSGQLLLACAREAAPTASDEVIALAGGEINHTAWALAKINLISHGYSSKMVTIANSLDSEGVLTSGGKQLTFDVVVAHPPWSARNWRDDSLPPDIYRRFDRGLPPRSNADYAFLLHMTSSMKTSGGRMAAIVSIGALTRTGLEGDIRKKLIIENLIDAVIGLPPKLFQGTPIAGAILVLRSNRPSNDILFIDAQDVCTPGRGRSALSSEAVNYLAEIYASRSSVQGRSVIATEHDVERNGFSLSIPLYVKTWREQDNRPLEEIRSDRMYAEHELQAVCREIEDLLKGLIESV